MGEIDFIYKHFRNGDDGQVRKLIEEVNRELKTMFPKNIIRIINVQIDFYANNPYGIYVFYQLINS
jgi:hypothetical protein